MSYTNEGNTRVVIKSLREELEAAKKQIESLLEKIRELEKLSITDELTGLYNWRHFRERLEQEVARNKRQKHPLCLIFFDVDSLKTHNDLYGHSGGDNVLKAVAQCVSRNIRKDVDSGYRYGGDEFAIILPETRAEQAVEVARRINRALSKMGFQNVTISIGVAELGAEMDSKTLFEHADNAMYMAKEDKANKIRLYNDDRSG